MPDQTEINCDVLIAGAGFSGALTALALHRCNFNVCVVEKEHHPRFAIGESSTPAADMILRKLSDAYNLPWLYHFSRYGSWQEHHRSVACGLKRGFSYYRHRKDKHFYTDRAHNNELLVAASSSDRNSDTNWLRSEFDAFLAEKVIEEGISYFDETEITDGAGDYISGWVFRAQTPRGSRTFRAGFFIDATGGSVLLEKVLRQVTSSSTSFLTCSCALFSHFEELPYWSTELDKLEIPQADYPYAPDHSALHHLMDEGWMWMLRFNNGRTSAGIMQNMDGGADDRNLPPEEEWSTVISSYPSISGLFSNPRLSTSPGRIIKTGRVQRRISKAAGPGWVALPHTAGFVDPLHSTGIAHTLSGVEKIVSILSEEWGNPDRLNRSLQAYEETVFKELEIIDLMVAGCYDSLPNFDLFHTWSMLYFAAAVQYEQERLRGERPAYFLLADRAWLTKLLNEEYPRIKLLVKKGGSDKIKQFQKRIKRDIEPYNTAGLMDPGVKNMYRHTAVEM